MGWGQVMYKAVVSETNGSVCREATEGEEWRLCSSVAEKDEKNEKMKRLVIVVGLSQLNYVQIS